MAGTLELVEYLPAWHARFDAGSTRIHAALGALATAIGHVGSTAVPGLVGKPVLDLAVAVAGEAAADACIAPLATLGYASYRGPYGDDPRRRRPRRARRTRPGRRRGAGVMTAPRRVAAVGGK